jgi:siroheme synthase-like protein
LEYYPVFLDLRGKPVLVVGAGKVALRKTRALLDAGAKVTVVAPEWNPEFEALPVQLLRRQFASADVNGVHLVFAATDKRAVNHAASAAARARGIPANVADAREECDFLVPARVRRGALQIAISTSGEDPGKAAALRRTIEQFLDAAGLV